MALRQKTRQYFKSEVMDIIDGPIEMPDLDTHQLCQPPSLDQQLLSTLDNNIKGNNWIQSHHCITMLRQVIKFHPQFIQDLVMRYGSACLDLFNNGKTQIIKNLLRFVKEVFDMGQQVNVERAVYSFLPIVLKKSSNDLGHIKEMSQHVLSSFSNNCGYNISFTIASAYCCDKNNQISEMSIKLLAKLIENIGTGIMKLEPDTLQNIMKNLQNLIEGKRQNVKNQSLDICLYIYSLIGSENYLSLMNYSLKPQEIMVMGMAMQAHKVSKQKQSVKKERVCDRKSVMMQRKTTHYYGNQGYGMYNGGQTLGMR